MLLAKCGTGVNSWTWQHHSKRKSLGQKCCSSMQHVHGVNRVYCELQRPDGLDHSPGGHCRKVSPHCNWWCTSFPNSETYFQDAVFLVAEQGLPTTRLQGSGRVAQDWNFVLLRDGTRCLRWGTEPMQRPGHHQLPLSLTKGELDYHSHRLGNKAGGTVPKGCR